MSSPSHALSEARFMRMLHDDGFRSSMLNRLDALQPDAQRQWGSMTPDQMLWHVNQFLGAALGEVSLPVQKSPMPPAVFRFVLIYLPWPKSSPTNTGALATARHDFDAQRARCRELIERFASRPLDGPWPADPTFGRVRGKWASRFQARHLDHHFRQFGV